MCPLSTRASICSNLTTSSGGIQLWEQNVSLCCHEQAGNTMKLPSHEGLEVGISCSSCHLMCVIGQQVLEGWVSSVSVLGLSAIQNHRLHVPPGKTCHLLHICFPFSVFSVVADKISPATHISSPSHPSVWSLDMQHRQLNLQDCRSHASL
jgi:hypothetical protein